MASAASAFLQYLETSCDGKIPFRLFLNTADSCCIAQCVVVVVVVTLLGEYSIVVQYSLYTSGLAAALFRIVFRGPDGTRWT
jgi:hypothetical protein